MEPSTSRAGATGVTGSEFVEGTSPAVLNLDDAHAEMIAQYAASLPQREEAERRTTNWGKYPSTSWARARKRNKKAKRKRPGKIREPPALPIPPLSPVRAIQGPINIRCSLQSGGGIVEQNPNIHRQESNEVALGPVDQRTLETTGNHAAVEVIDTGCARVPTDWTNLPDHLGGFDTVAGPASEPACPPTFLRDHESPTGTACGRGVNLNEEQESRRR